MKLTPEAKSLLKDILKWCLLLFVLAAIAIALVIGIANQKSKTEPVKADSIRIESNTQYNSYKKEYDSLKQVNDNLNVEITNLHLAVNNLMKKDNEKASYFVDTMHAIDSAEIYIANRIERYRKEHLLLAK